MTNSLSQLDLERLDAESTLRTLRLALATAKLQQSALAFDGETRARLEEALLREGASATPEGDPALQALRVLAADSDYRGLPLDTFKASQRDFAVDPIQLMSAGSLALVVLSTYVDLKRTQDGKWSFHFRVKPQSDAIKTAILELAKQIATRLPRE